MSVFDGPLALIVFLIMSVGIVTLYSAGIDFPGRVEDQLRNILICFVIMWIAASVPPPSHAKVAFTAAAPERELMAVPVPAVPSSPASE